MNKKVVMITGASGDIGQTLAKKFASENCDLILHYNKNEKIIDELISRINKTAPIKILKVQADIGNEENVKKMVNIILQNFSTIDVLVNNSAVENDTLFQDKSGADFLNTMKVNVVGTFLVSKYIGEIMWANKSGKIINISSTNGMNTYYPMCIDYDASKSAIISLTHNLATQFAPYVNVNAIAPGFIATSKEIAGFDEDFLNAEKDKIMLKKFGTESDIAELISFLASDKSNFINNTIIRVDGGIYGSN